MNPRQSNPYLIYLNGKNIFDRMRAYVLLLSQGAVDVPYISFRRDLVREFDEQTVYNAEQEILESNKDIIFGDYSLKALIMDFYANPQDPEEVYNQRIAQREQRERLRRQEAGRHIPEPNGYLRPRYDTDDDYRKGIPSKWLRDKLLVGGPTISMIEEDEISDISSIDLSQATTLVSEHPSEYASEESSQYSQFATGFTFTNSFSVPNKQKPQDTPVFKSTFGKGGKYGDMSMEGDFDTQIPMSETSVDGNMSGKKYVGRRGNKMSTEGEMSVEETLQPNRSGNIPTTVVSSGNTDTQNVLDMMAANLQQQQVLLNSAKKPAATITSKTSKLNSSKSVKPTDEKKPHRLTKDTKITKENKSDKMNPPTIISTQPETQSVYNDDESLETGSSGYSSYDISDISEDGRSFTGVTKKIRSGILSSNTSSNLSIREKRPRVYWSLSSIPLKIENLGVDQEYLIDVDGIHIKNENMYSIRTVLAIIIRLANGRVEESKVEKEMSLLGPVGRKILELAQSNANFKTYLLDFKFPNIPAGKAYALGRTELKELAQMYNRLFLGTKSDIFLLMSNADYSLTKDIFGWALFCFLFNNKDLNFSSK